MTQSGWPTPVGATELLPADVQAADHDRWLATRREGLGGSDVAAVLGLVSWSSPYTVWLDKTGQLPPQDQTYLMERGHRFEAPVAQWFADEARLSLRRTGTWARDADPWMRANPDRFTSDGAGYEGKVAGEDWGRLWRYGPAQHAFYQSLWCMAVTGLDAWYLAAAMDHTFRWWRLERAVWIDEMEEMVDRCSLWWYRHIEQGDPPPVDDSEATSEALRAAYRTPEIAWRDFVEPAPLSHAVEVPGLVALREKRRTLKRDAAALERELRGIENQIKAGLGPHAVGYEHGRPVMGWPAAARTGVDSAVLADLLNDHPELLEQYPGLIAKTPYRRLETY